MTRLLLLLAMPALFAQESLLPPEALASFQPKDPAAGYLKLDASASSLRIETSRKPERRQDLALTMKLPGAAAAGDVMHLRFQLRAVTPPASGEAGVEIALRPGRSNWSLPLNMPAPATAEWRWIEYPFVADRSYSPNQAELVLTPGDAPQTVEVRALELLNYHRTKQLPELATTRYFYHGQQADAAWRKAARQRIEQHRKADLTVSVRNARGRPVPGAQVSVRMTRHAFGFGTAVSGPMMFGTRAKPENQETYRRLLRELFNKAVPENDLKWQFWENRENRQRTIAMVESLRDSGIEMRGHCLIWPSWRNAGVPATHAARKDPAALAKVVLDHIRETAETMSGRVTEWDVLNELYTNHDLADLLPETSPADWFRAARSADPKAKLYINDFNILEEEDTKHQDHYFQTIQSLIRQNAPLDGIGLQCHFPARLTPIDELERRLARFASFGKALQVTEFDVDTNDELTQADYTRDVMTLAFSHPAMEGFMFWGFWEGSHWKPKDAMFRTDWTEKPNARVYKDLVFKEWWTRAAGPATKAGQYQTRGFLGDYEIEVRAGARTRTVKARLEKAGSRVEVVLD